MQVQISNIAFFQFLNSAFKIHNSTTTCTGGVKNMAGLKFEWCQEMSVYKENQHKREEQDPVKTGSVPHSNTRWTNCTAHYNGLLPHYSSHCCVLDSKKLRQTPKSMQNLVLTSSQFIQYSFIRKQTLTCWFIFALATKIKQIVVEKLV